MSESELFIAGIGVSKSVVSTIVTLAAEKVEGVVRVGGNDIASNLVSVFTSRAVPPEATVESEVVDGELKVAVHLSVHQACGVRSRRHRDRDSRAGRRRGRLGGHLHRFTRFPQGVEGSV